MLFGSPASSGRGSRIVCEVQKRRSPFRKSSSTMTTPATPTGGRGVGGTLSSMYTVRSCVRGRPSADRTPGHRLSTRRYHSRLSRHRRKKARHGVMATDNDTWSRYSRTLSNIVSVETTRERASLAPCSGPPMLDAAELAMTSCIVTPGHPSPDNLKCCSCEYGTGAFDSDPLQRDMDQ